MTTSTGLTRVERKRIGRTKRGFCPRSPTEVEGTTLQSPLLTIPETCAYTKLARSVIYERLHEFDVVKLGKRRFITRASADRYIGRNTTPASSAA